MNKQMPTMNNNLGGEETLLPPESDILEAPKYKSLEKDNDSNVSIPKPPKDGIEVVATRKGFYNQTRLNEGQKFKVRKKEDLATWMECVEPALERERIKLLNEKRAKK